MKFIEQLPFFYYEDENVNSIQEALESENLICRNKIQDTLNQLYIDTATWSLSLWEEMLGVKTNTNDTELRRKTIKSKLKSRGAVTPSKLVNIATSYTNSDVELNEYPSEYYFEICMVLNSISEKEFLTLKNTIDEIKPCHLDAIYKWMLKQIYSLHIALTTLDIEKITIYPLLDIAIVGKPFPARLLY